MKRLLYQTNVISFTYLIILTLPLIALALSYMIASTVALTFNHLRAMTALVTGMLIFIFFLVMSVLFTNMLVFIFMLAIITLLAGILVSARLATIVICKFTVTLASSILLVAILLSLA